MTLYCPTCGYNLTGLPQNRCPECGKTFDPRQVGIQQARRSRLEMPDEITPGVVVAWLLLLPALVWGIATLSGLAGLFDAGVLLILLLAAAPFMLAIAHRIGRRIAFTQALADERPREWLAAGGRASRFTLGLWAAQMILALGPVAFAMILLTR